MKQASTESAPRWVVMKFGGTSVATAAGWRTIAGLIRARREAGLRPVVVHSALAGISNRLEEAMRTTSMDPAYYEADDLDSDLEDLWFYGPAVLYPEG